MHPLTRPLLILLPIFFLLSLCRPPLLAAKDKVIWLKTVMPPYFIAEKNGKKGYGDEISAFIEESLTGYDHESMVTNITRHFYKFKQGEQVCSAGLFRTPEREEFMHFSMPSFLTLPAVIIIKKDNFSAFGSRSQVRLDDLLKEEKLTFGLAKDRSYGEEIDKVLKRHQGHENHVVFAGPELSENFFKMLMLGRIDGLLGLPDEALYQAEQLGIRDKLMTLSIEENQTGYEGWLSAVGCAKTPWGKRIIDDINTVLLEERPTERYRGAYERWLDANSIENYRRIYEEVFLKITR